MGLIFDFYLFKIALSASDVSPHKCFLAVNKTATS